jgi:hypothetical protein
MDLGPFYGFTDEQIAADKAERDRIDTERFCGECGPGCTGHGPLIKDGDRALCRTHWGSVGEYRVKPIVLDGAAKGDRFAGPAGKGL